VPNELEAFLEPPSGYFGALLLSERPNDGRDACHAANHDHSRYAAHDARYAAADGRALYSACGNSPPRPSMSGALGPPAAYAPPTPPSASCTLSEAACLVDTAQIRVLREHASALQRHLAATAERVRVEDEVARARVLARERESAQQPRGRLDEVRHDGFDASDTWAALYMLNGEDEHARREAAAGPTPADASEPWRGYYVN
jgi:hypothetical protein